MSLHEDYSWLVIDFVILKLVSQPLLLWEPNQHSTPAYEDGHVGRSRKQRVLTQIYIITSFSLFNSLGNDDQSSNAVGARTFTPSNVEESGYTGREVESKKKNNAFHEVPSPIGAGPPVSCIKLGIGTPVGLLACLCFTTG